MRLLTRERDPFEGDAFVETIPRPWDPFRRARGPGRPVVDASVGRVDLHDGDYVLFVAPDGYAWFQRPFTIRNGADVDLGDVVLDGGLSVSGRVVDGAGLPVVGATVRCEENSERSARTDEVGGFAFDHFPRGRVTLTIDAEGFSGASLVVRPPKTSGLEVTLSRPALVRGVIRWADGEPARQVSVVLRRPDAPLAPEAAAPRDGALAMPEPEERALETDASGRFESPVAMGRWTAWWWDAEGGDHRVGDWTFVEGGTHEIAVRLPGP